MGRERDAQGRLNDDDGQTGYKCYLPEFSIPLAGLGKHHPGGDVTEGEHPEKEHDDVGLRQTGQV